MSKIAMSLRLAVLVSGLAAPAVAQELLVVTSSADSGQGTLRAALAAASVADAPVTIAITATGAIMFDNTLVYSGTAPLAIVGSGQTLASTNNVTLLAATRGADLSISDLTFQGPGGFSIENRGDLAGPAGKGIFVALREDQDGVVRLDLSDVTVRDTAGHGVHVSDCTLADACGGGSGGGGGGSDASIELRLNRVTISNVGQGGFDADGIRVDERGAGDIVFHAIASTFTGVGADGVELDEGQGGDVVVQVVSSAFLDNGSYCNPAVLSGFMPAETEGSFRKGRVAQSDIPGPVTGSPDDRCIERDLDLYNDGSVEAYEFAIDLDDGFDIDEAGPGSIRAVVVRSDISGNRDQGLDLDEEGAGDVLLTLVGTVGSDNGDDGLKTSEEDAGSVMARMVEAAALRNGGTGVVFEEEDGGDVSVSAIDLWTRHNDGGDTGLEVTQDDAGEGSLSLITSRIEDGLETEGVSVSD